MNNEIMTVEEFTILSKNVQRFNELTNKINTALNDASSKFLEVGATLYRVRQEKLYEIEEYEDIYEYASDKFGLKRTTTSNFMNMFIRFGTLDEGYSIKGYSLKDEFKEYNLSQLTELVSVPEDDIKKFTPSMTVKEIRSVKALSKIDDYIKQVSAQVDYKKLIEHFIHDEDVNFTTADEVFNLNIDMAFKENVYSPGIVGNIMFKAKKQYKTEWRKGSIYADIGIEIRFQNNAISMRIDFNYSKESWRGYSKSLTFSNEEDYITDNILVDPIFNEILTAYHDGKKKALQEIKQLKVGQENKERIAILESKYLKKWLSFNELQGALENKALDRLRSSRQVVLDLFHTLSSKNEWMTTNEIDVMQGIFWINDLDCYKVFVKPGKDILRFGFNNNNVVNSIDIVTECSNYYSDVSLSELIGIGDNEIYKKYIRLLFDALANYSKLHDNEKNGEE